ncbi:hypothetical protein SUGI_0958240 [Cryptomeria japonica]|nr:hypothetical protein SUGI_0958240 [Cryptomeria japonica]
MRKFCTTELLSAKRTELFRWVREEEATAMVRSLWEGSEKGSIPSNCEIPSPPSHSTLSPQCAQAEDPPN